MAMSARAVAMSTSFGLSLWAAANCVRRARFAASGQDRAKGLPQRRILRSKRNHASDALLGLRRIARVIARHCGRKLGSQPGWIQNRRGPARHFHELGLFRRQPIDGVEGRVEILRFDLGIEKSDPGLKIIGSAGERRLVKPARGLRIPAGLIGIGDHFQHISGNVDALAQEGLIFGDDVIHAATVAHEGHAIETRSEQFGTGRGALGRKLRDLMIEFRDGAIELRILLRFVRSRQVTRTHGRRSGLDGETPHLGVREQLPRLPGKFERPSPIAQLSQLNDLLTARLTI